MPPGDRILHDLSSRMWRRAAVGGRTMKMTGKTVLITGSTDGVGRYVARRLAEAGAQVLLHGRDAVRAKALIDEIVQAGHAAPTFYQADLSSMSGTRELAAAVRRDHKRLDVFVSNAGIGSQNDGPQRQESADGYELRFAVNYLVGLPAGVPAAAAVEGRSTFAHRQCRLARSASDRFRRRHDHAGATAARAPTRRASSRRSCSPSISREELKRHGHHRQLRCIRRPT